MAFPTKLFTLVLASLLSSSLVLCAARHVPRSSLSERLKVAGEGEGEGPSTCWDALLELQSCSGEVVMFFLNGETRLGLNCCDAIRVIERQCWPSMLGTLGITAEESDVLRGYCDATASAVAPPPASASSLDQCYNFPRLQH